MARLCRNCSDPTCRHTNSACLGNARCFKPKSKATESTTPSGQTELVGCTENETMPPMGHPLQLLGARLADLLDADDWNNIEPMLLDVWEHNNR